MFVWGVCPKTDYNKIANSNAATIAHPNERSIASVILVIITPI